MGSGHALIGEEPTELGQEPLATGPEHPGFRFDLTQTELRHGGVKPILATANGTDHPARYSAVEHLS
jgi:hypothetical protein